MTKSPPPDDELWTSAGPLQPPSDAAAARAKPIFERWLNEVRDTVPRQPSSQPVAPPVGDPPRWQVGGGRRYDLALTVALGAQQARQLMDAATLPALPTPFPAVAAAPVSPPPMVSARAPAPTPRASSAPPRAPGLPAVRAPMRPDRQGLLSMEDDPTTISQDSTLEPTVIHALPDETTHTSVRLSPSRPPPGAAMVRPALKTGQKAVEVNHEVWQQTADTAHLRTQSDGGMAFDIMIRDDVFADLSCTIAVNDGHATATFRVGDVNTRRLLEAEVGRLRAALEGRGLRVDKVDVVVSDELGT